MTRRSLQPLPVSPWTLARRQHGVLTRTQLLDLGLSREAIQHRIERGQLHPLARGIYAVGRPEVDGLGRWMAAVLSCGPEALLGYRSAAALWGMLEQTPATIEVVVPSHVSRCRPGVRVHRRRDPRPEERAEHERIPVTSPAATVIDLASQLGDQSLESVVNAADRLGLVDPEALRAEADACRTRPCARRLGRLLDRFTRTDSNLERKFLALVRRAGLPEPQTQATVNGFRVDFFWPRLGLVAETDGLRYHRTPTQQSRDLRRDQVHLASGLKALRFSAAQVLREPASVIDTLRNVVTTTPNR